MPKISFLIATKNRGHLIKDTLNSLLQQSEGDWEALIIDDHSVDDTEEVVENFKDPRFRYFQLNSAHGSGASCARNFGAIYAKSDLIAILDSDDIAYPNRTALTLKAFEDRELDVFYGNLDLWNEKNGAVYDRPLKLGPPTVEQMKQFYFIPHSTVTIKRSVLLNNPYNQFFKIAEDFELFSRLLIQGKKFSFTYEKIMKYRVHEGNISIGPFKNDLMKWYDQLVRMSRGWIPFNQEILDKIEDRENR